MSEELRRLAAASRRWRNARAEVLRLIVEAADADVAQRDIVEATGFTREHIRRIVKEAREARAAAAEQAAAE